MNPLRHALALAWLLTALPNLVLFLVIDVKPALIAVAVLALAVAALAVYGLTHVSVDVPGLPG